MNKLFITFVLIIVSVMACSKKEEKPAEGMKSTIVPEDTISSSSDVTIGSPTINPGDTSEKYLADISSRIKEIENNELVKMLPKSIPGTEKLPSDIGSINEDGKDYVVVFGTYKYPEGQVSIELTDYTAERFIPENILTGLRKLPPEGKNIILGKISMDEYWGFNYFNENMKKGFIKLIVAGRFYVQISYENVPVSYTEVVKAVGMMNIKGMMKYKN